MSKQPARLRILITNAIAAILAILVFGLTTSYAKPSEPTPFLSPTGGGLTPRAWLPIVMKNYPFFYSTSYYVKIADYNTLYNLGCSQGSVTADGQDIVVVLDFGEPWYSSGTYGALIFDANLTARRQRIG